jgi:uncharacterized protein
MKLDPAPNDGSYSFSGYGEGYVAINGQRHSNNLVILPRQLIPEWTAHRFEQLTEDDFATLAGLGAQILLLGTGRQLRFPEPRLTRPLIEAGIGLEVMDTKAACRTYNILASEGRSVACALLID